MHPKKVKEFIPGVAAKLGLPEDLVTDVVAFYYEELRRNLTQMNESIFRLDGLGSFKAKPKELPKLYMKFKGQLEAMASPRTQIRIKIKLDIEQKLANVLKLQRKIAAENKRKYEFYRAKENGTQKLARDLAKEKRDLRRAKKQNFQKGPDREDGD